MVFGYGVLFKDAFMNASPEARGLVVEGFAMAFPIVLVLIPFCVTLADWKPFGWWCVVWVVCACVAFYVATWVVLTYY